MRGEQICVTVVKLIVIYINLYNSDEYTKGLIGRKMDLIMTGSIINDTGKKEDIELGTIEIKKNKVFNILTL